MALKVGELFATLNLRDETFTSGLAAAMAALTRTARSAAAQLDSAGRSSGRQFASGLAAGILSGSSAVSSAARRVAEAAVAAANARLRIASPSRVMEQTGGYFAAGFADGILRGARLAVDAADRMAAASAASAAAPAPAPAFDYERLERSLAGRELALYLDGRRLAQLSAAENARAQTARSRSLALGYGVNWR